MDRKRQLDRKFADYYSRSFGFARIIYIYIYIYIVCVCVCVCVCVWRQYGYGTLLLFVS